MLIVASWHMPTYFLRVTVSFRLARYFNGKILQVVSNSATLISSSCWNLMPIEIIVPHSLSEVICHSESSVGSRSESKVRGQQKGHGITIKISLDCCPVHTCLRVSSIACDGTHFRGLSPLAGGLSICFSCCFSNLHISGPQGSDHSSYFFPVGQYILMEINYEVITMCLSFSYAHACATEMEWDEFTERQLLHS